MSFNHSYAVVIVDDHAMFIEAMKKALATFDYINVVGAYTTTEGCLRNIEAKKPEVVFMDITMKTGKMDGIEATREILKKRPETIVVAISMHEDAHYVKQMMSAGARGYMSKGLSLKTIKYLFEHIQENKIYISPPHLRHNLDLADESESEDLPTVTQSDFTPHQLEILHWSSKEKTDKEIGDLLKVPTKEIEYQKTKIGKILGVRRTTAMIARAYALGILPLKGKSEN